MASDDAVVAFFQRQLDLLAVERDCEREEFALLTSPGVLAGQIKLLEKRGLTLGSLGVRNVNIGLGGKTLIELERPTAYHTDPNLPHHELSVGTPVRIIDHSISSGKSTKAGASAYGAAKPVDAVIARVGRTSITVAVAASNRGGEDEEPELPSRIRLIKMPDTSTYDRLDKTMKSLIAAFGGSTLPSNGSKDSEKPAAVGHLHRVLLGLDRPAPPQEPPTAFVNTGPEIALNESQVTAVRHALQHELTLVFGPPGTGKTHTLISIISELVALGNRVLVAAGSNLAVDNICERLHGLGIPLTRIGHPARVLPGVVASTLDHQAAHSDSAALVRDLHAEINTAFKALSAGGKERLRGKARAEKHAEIKELKRDYRRREGGVVKGVLAAAKVVCATCHGSGGRLLEGQRFDVVLIDEATQAMEAACWIPLLKAEKNIILAGDPLQLPPTVKSLNSKTGKAKGKKGTELEKKQSKTEGAPAGPGRALAPSPSLEKTLYDRLMAMGVETCLLETQYRMHERIMRFPSDTLYGSKLKADPEVASRLLRDLPNVAGADVDGLADPVLFIDTSGAFMYDRKEDGDSDSMVNENEAELVVKHFKSLVDAGLAPNMVSIISPYSAQVALLASLLRQQYPDLQIGSVDSNQGRENEAVIISLVRSNEEGEVGFLKENRRLNVAMTRPKRHLAVIGDSSTVSKGSKFLESWMAWLEENAEVRVAGM